MPVWKASMLLCPYSPLVLQHSSEGYCHQLQKQGLQCQSSLATPEDRTVLTRHCPSHKLSVHPPWSSWHHQYSKTFLPSSSSHRQPLVSSRNKYTVFRRIKESRGSQLWYIKSTVTHTKCSSFYWYLWPWLNLIILKIPIQPPFKSHMAKLT